MPIAPDLSDLEDKYIWAENNPELAQKISMQAVELTKQVGSSDGFARMYREDFVEPLRRIIDAYRPVSDTDPSKTWIDILKSEGQGIAPALTCQGYSNLDLCDHIGFEDVEQDIPQEDDGDSSAPEQPQPKSITKQMTNQAEILFQAAIIRHWKISPVHTRVCTVQKPVKVGDEW